MTRNWLALASRTLRMDRNRTGRPVRRGAGLALESLEARLAFSSVPAAPVPMDLNPQPLPPGYVVGVHSHSLAPDVQGAHIGYEMVQGAHIGYEMIQGNHPGYECIQGNHIGANVSFTLPKKQ